MQNSILIQAIIEHSSVYYSSANICLNKTKYFYRVTVRNLPVVNRKAQSSINVRMDLNLKKIIDKYFSDCII